MDAGVREAVEAHVAAINALDAEAAAAGFAADGVFTGSDDEAVGQREVYGLFRDAFAEVAAVDMELVRLVATGDTAACELVERIRWLQGAVLELRLAAFYTVIEGSITRVRVYRFFPG